MVRLKSIKAALSPAEKDTKDKNITCRNYPSFSPPPSSTTMPIQDRTNEFRSCVESIRSRSSLPSRSDEAKQRLLNDPSRPQGSKSEFSRMASAIGKDISSTTIKLGKLAQCAYSSYRYG